MESDTFKLNEMFCCPPFQNHVGAAGERGLSIVVRKSANGIRFMLQSRGIAFEDIEKARALSELPDVKINLNSSIALKFCPWCGRKVEELAALDPVAYENLAKSHLKFIPEIARFH